MWREGMIHIKSQDGTYKEIKFQIKVHDEACEFGIEGGRITRLWLEMDGKMIALFDHGWELAPSCREASLAILALKLQN